MSVRSGQSITADFVTTAFATGAATAADSLPTGTLVVNGTDDAAAVTVTSKTGGKYKAAVTLPTLAIGDVVQIRIAATVNSVAGIGVIWTDAKDISLDSNGKTTDSIQTGDTYALANGASGFVATKADTAAILTDTNEIQTDWVNGGRLDLILDARASQTSVDDVPTNAELATALGTSDDATLAAIAALNNITAAQVVAAMGTGVFLTAIPWNVAWDAEVQSECADALTAYGASTLTAAQVNAEADTAISDAALATAANLATVAGYLDTEIAAILADTNELQTDWANGGRLDLILDTAATNSGDVTVDAFGAGALAQLAALRHINAHGALVTEGAISGIVIGDDYLAADGRQLIFSNTAGSWADLTGATIALVFVDPFGNEASVSCAGSVNTPTGTGQRVDVSLTAAQTATLTPSHKRFRLDATLSNGHLIRLEGGTAEITE